MDSCTSNCNIYNQTEAYIPLYYSYASYCNPSNLNKWDCKWCNKASNNFETKQVISSDYLQAFIGIDNDINRIVIAFRGTHNYEDWFKDLEYKQIPYPNIPNAHVHEGFYNAYIEIQKYGLISSLQSLLSSHPDVTNILITGHSMGGALTELCALDIMENKIINTDINIDIYTFGCPRWADRELAEYIDSLGNIDKKWRIVNKNDPVAIVPGKFLGEFGFYHTSTEILYTNYQNLEYIVCDGSGEDTKCGYSLWTEQKNAHLWYLNIHENCGLDDGHTVYPETLSFGSEQHSDGQQEKVSNTHWALSIILICVGFVVAMIYYFLTKRCQKRNGYKNIPNDIKKEEEENKLRKKQIMKKSLLDNTKHSNSK